MILSLLHLECLCRPIMDGLLTSQIFNLIFNLCKKVYA